MKRRKECSPGLEFVGALTFVVALVALGAFFIKTLCTVWADHSRIERLSRQMESVSFGGIYYVDKNGNLTTGNK